MSVVTFYISSGVFIKTSWYFIYYWEYLDSQSDSQSNQSSENLTLKSFDWKVIYLQHSRFQRFHWLYLTFANLVSQESQYAEQNNLVPRGKLLCDDFDIVSLQSTKSSRITMALGARVKATYRYNYPNLLYLLI